jgi:hypothetical protein
MNSSIELFNSYIMNRYKKMFRFSEGIRNIGRINKMEKGIIRTFKFDLCSKNYRNAPSIMQL